jgi:hypothetical protein
VIDIIYQKHIQQMYALLIIEEEVIKSIGYFATHDQAMSALARIRTLVEDHLSIREVNEAQCYALPLHGMNCNFTEAMI